MMALFIVLWIMSQGNEVREKVAEYFKNPIGIAVGKGNLVVEGKTALVKEPLMTEDKRIQEEIEKEKLKKMEEKIIEKMQESPEFKEVAQFVQMQMTDEGLRIELMESANDVFFEIGTSKLNNKATQLLRMIGEQLAKLDNKIVIEGHTDARPYQNGVTGYTNYELSTDRANSARRALSVGGLLEKQINEIRGYADKKLKNPADPYDLVNRRISILVKNSGAK